MIKCKDCDYNVNGYCHRNPPTFFSSGVGRKWLFPLIFGFEDFKGCGEGRPHFTITPETGVQVPRRMPLGTVESLKVEAPPEPAPKPKRTRRKRNG